MLISLFHVVRFKCGNQMLGHSFVSCCFLFWTLLSSQLYTEIQVVLKSLCICLLFTNMLQPPSDPQHPASPSKHSQCQVKAIYLKQKSSVHVTSLQLDWHLTSFDKAALTVSVTAAVRATADHAGLMWTDLSLSTVCWILMSTVMLIFH